MILAPETTETLAEIVSHAENKGLVLFVGAGISAGIVPLWNNLLGELLEVAIDEAATEDSRIGKRNREALLKWAKDHFDEAGKASLIKQILGPKRYRIEVRDAIYRKCPEASKQLLDEIGNGSIGKSGSKFEGLYQVARLCSHSCIRAVATFNFDTLLETAIECLTKRVPRPIAAGASPLVLASGSQADLPIFHLHGRLLPTTSLIRDLKESVVFSYDEYFEKNADPLSWETTTPLHLLRTYCSLWLGTSMKDWNMLRLLHGAHSDPDRPHIYTLQSLREVEAAKPHRKVAMRFQATLFRAVGVRLAVAGPNYSDVWRVLTEHITNRLPVDEPNKGTKSCPKKN